MDTSVRLDRLAMRSLTLAGVPLDVIGTDWDLSARPATLVVRAKNSRVLLDRLTAALRGVDMHKAQARELTATVRVLSLTTDKYKITLHLSPVETRPAQATG
jgi:hypothetical protein